MEMLISSLKEIIANVRIIDSNTIDTTKVSILSSVKIININIRGFANLYLKLLIVSHILAMKKNRCTTYISLPLGDKLSLEILNIYYLLFIIYLQYKYPLLLYIYNDMQQLQ